jgi:ADP-ribose pyrophosphatase
VSEGEAAVVWEGKYIKALKQGPWEFVSRTRGVTAAVILAVDDGHVILVEQHRVPLGSQSLELPAGLVGDEDPHATPESTAIKELEEETGFTADRVEPIGEFFASPGMMAESFTLMRAHGVRRIGEGGGDDNEDINVHLVPRGQIANFLEQKRAEGFGVDVKLLLFLNY